MNELNMAEFIKVVQEGQVAFSRAINLLEEMDGSAENAALRRALLNAIGLVVSDVVLPVISKHPQLNPYE
ncbi:hypothetical protein [Pseudomonas indica]|uniref:hypothetical protein n=1 Tax=Pseudomonas indica TaxID=137658 RepID=UPI003FD0AE46